MDGTKQTYQLLSLLSNIFVLSTVFYVRAYHPELTQFSFYLALIPISWASFIYGFWAGLFNSIFYIVLIIMDSKYIIGGNAILQQISSFSLAISFIILAYLSSDLSATVKSRQTLQSITHRWETMVTGIRHPESIARLLISYATSLIPSEEVGFILKNPTSPHTLLLIFENGTHQLFPDIHDDRASLANWFMSQKESRIFNHLDHQSNLFEGMGKQDYSMHSLLSAPLFFSEKESVLGAIVFLNKLSGDYSFEDLQAIKHLTTIGEKTISQSSHYALTGYSLNRLIEYLLALQESSKDLYGTVDINYIQEKTLMFGLEIFGGEAGGSYMEIPGYRSPVVTGDSYLLSPQVMDTLISEYYKLPTSITVHQRSDPGAKISPRSGMWIIVPIWHGSEYLGLFVLASENPDQYDEYSLQVINSLADQTAIAIENAILIDHLNQQTNRNLLIFNSVGDGLITLDNRMRVVEANPAAIEITGRNPNDGSGMSICSYLKCHPRNCRHENCLFFQNSGKDISAYQKMRIRTEKEEEKVIILRQAPLLENDHTSSGSVVMFSDISAFEELDRLESELISTISHEMRTPISNLGNVAEMLELDLSEGETTQLVKYSQMITGEAERVNDLLDRILEVHNLESGKVQVDLRPIAVPYVAHHCVYEWKINHPAREFQILFDDQKPILAWGDENELIVVLNNLLDNAVKYSQPGSKITVTIRETRDENVILGVIDEGIGITPAHQKKIFNRFYRVSGEDNQIVYGHGLGLYICKKLMTAMGGDIWVESEPERGSRFYISLPTVTEELKHEPQTAGH